MTPTDILTPVILGLAFYGYVQCLAHWLWLTLCLTVMVAALVSLSFPFVAANALIWLGAGVVFVVAFIAARLWPAEDRPGTRKPAKSSATAQQHIVIDGTNVLYWDGNEPSLGTLRSVVDHLKLRGFLPWIFLDASSRHHLKDKSLTEKGFAKALGLRANRVMVCPAGTEADAFIIGFAKSEALPIVSNDRFGDRAHQAKGIKLFKGIVANGKPILEGL